MRFRDHAPVIPARGDPSPPAVRPFLPDPRECRQLAHRRRGRPAHRGGRPRCPVPACSAGTGHHWRPFRRGPMPARAGGRLPRARGFRRPQRGRDAGARAKLASRMRGRRAARRTTALDLRRHGQKRRLHIPARMGLQPASCEVGQRMPIFAPSSSPSPVVLRRLHGTSCHAMPLIRAFGACPQRGAARRAARGFASGDVVDDGSRCAGWPPARPRMTCP
jgi:hypothetical protein